MCGLFLDTLFSSIDLYHYRTVFITVALKEVLKSGSGSPSILLFFKLVFAILGPWYFKINFRLRLSISTKMPAEFWPARVEWDLYIHLEELIPCLYWVFWLINRVYLLVYFSLVSLSNVLYFLAYRSFISFLIRKIPKYFIFLMLL